jgi:mono/diheme cytochrome c family protein
MAAAAAVVACTSDNNDTTGSADGSTDSATNIDTGTGGTPDGGGAGDADAGQTPAQRGEYLVKHVIACGDCHTPRKADGSFDDTMWLAGNPGLFQIPGLGPDGGVGIIGPRNLTPDQATGIGLWTDAQIKNAILNGIDDQGEPLFSIMPYYVFHNMTSDDADAIVAYLRTIPAVHNAVPERNFDVAAAAQPVPTTAIPDPNLPTSDPSYASAMRGKYLAGSVGICMECHTTHVQAAVPLDTTKLFAGGDDFPSAALGLPAFYPPVIYSENITQDATGIQGWTAADVLTVLKEGKDKGGHAICPPMPVGPDGAFGGLTDADALDIANYVVHLPGVANTVSPICHKVLADAGH